MKDTNPKLYSFIEALKELGRYLVSIGLMDSAIAIFQLIQSGINTQTGAININWQLILAFSLFSLSGGVIRAMDKYKHEVTKLVSPTLENQNSPLGIFPF